MPPVSGGGLEEHFPVPLLFSPFRTCVRSVTLPACLPSVSCPASSPVPAAPRTCMRTPVHVQRPRVPTPLFPGGGLVETIVLLRSGAGTGGEQSGGALLL